MRTWKANIKKRKVMRKKEEKLKENTSKVWGTKLVSWPLIKTGLVAPVIDSICAAVTSGCHPPLLCSAGIFQNIPNSNLLNIHFSFWWVSKLQEVLRQYFTRLYLSQQESRSIGGLESRDVTSNWMSSSLIDICCLRDRGKVKHDDDSIFSMNVTFLCEWYQVSVWLWKSLNYSLSWHNPPTFESFNGLFQGCHPSRINTSSLNIWEETRGGRILLYLIYSYDSLVACPVYGIRGL